LTEHDTVGVTAVSLRTHLDLGISNVMMTVLGASSHFSPPYRKPSQPPFVGVVIGFVISYRASCGYDEYMTGRTAWSDVVKNTYTLMRLIWFHVPLRLTPKTAEELTKPVVPPRSKEEMEAVMTEKRAALDLLEG
jgi:putative membrane protein